MIWPQENGNLSKSKKIPNFFDKFLNNMDFLFI